MAGSTSRLQRQTNRDSTIRYCPTRAKPRHILNWLKMASGYGMNGGVGRCFPFWQEVMGCYVVNTTAADDSGKKKCGLVLEDYYECLHHKKEHARALAMQAAYARSESATARDDAPSVKQIRSLGLIDKEEDTKKVLGQS